ncbi:MAG: ribosome biogenesis GTPase Der [Pseudomonadota bacterium]
MTSQLAQISIVGRPNVGKSSLFNRLVGKRRALIDPQAGTTRDYREEIIDLAPEQSITLCDTAGLTGEEDPLLSALTEQAIAASDLLVFVVDGITGLTAIDIDLAQRLRRFAKPILLVANKCDHHRHEDALQEPLELGFGPPVAISAEHNRGLDVLVDEILQRLTPRANPTPHAEKPGDLRSPLRFAFLGRPNVGKSSLTNRLVGHARMMTSHKAGTTRESIPIMTDGYLVVDTAGIRPKSKTQESLDIASTRQAITILDHLTVAVLVIDAATGWQKQDRAIVKIIADHHKPLIIAANKWDLIKDRKQRHGQLLEGIDALLQAAILVPVSAHKGFGMGNLTRTLMRIHRRALYTITTGRLNRWLRKTIEHHPPPMIGGRRAKLRYITQLAAPVPTFMIAGNLKTLPQGYQRYLTNQLRTHFSLQGLPIRWVTHKGSNPYAT